MHRLICAAIITPIKGTYTHELLLDSYPETG